MWAFDAFAFDKIHSAVMVEGGLGAELGILRVIFAFCFTLVAQNAKIIREIPSGRLAAVWLRAAYPASCDIL